ncbi:uncharacterized protein LOC141719305 [Apium graveolens]|uniref:uncharacterized protein LOC141719305 n=1 Tax=Apium graveolens TaxID=4045 RepID=UPI003D7C001D
MALSKLPELTGRMAKWLIRVSTYDISYDARTTIKSQALADFVVDFSPTQLTQAEEELKQVTSQVEIQPWTLYIDGASNVNGTATNNEAEYEALIMGLITAKDLKVPREQNAQADALAGLGAVFKDFDVATVPTLHINKPANERMLEVSEVNAININLDNSQDGWTKFYKDYLQNGQQPDSSNDARVLRRKVSRFSILDDVLFKKSSTGTLQRCIEKNEADMVLRDVHEGDCGNHTNGRNLSLKILRMGYYWSTL